MAAIGTVTQMLEPIVLARSIRCSHGVPWCQVASASVVRSAQLDSRFELASTMSMMRIVCGLSDLRWSTYFVDQTWLAVMLGWMTFRSFTCPAVPVNRMVSAPTLAGMSTT